jgi:photosystem II stability/assembly factor-like uncharacterized protein
MSALASAPSLPTTLYTAAGDGRFFRSLDGGETWEPRRQIAFTYVQALAVDSIDPDTLYAAAQSGLYKSSDGGASWAFNLPEAASLVAVDPSDGGTVYAVVGPKDHLLRSTDAGSHWLEITGALANLDLAAIVIDPAMTSTIYVGANGGVFESIDSGKTWHPSGLTGASVQDLVLDGATLYAATLTQGVFKSVDQGGSWVPASGGLPSPDVYRLLAMQGIVFAAVVSNTTPDTLFETADGGDTWAPTGTGLPKYGFASALARGGPASGAVFVATAAGLFRTLDLGASWAASERGLAANPAFLVAVSALSSLAVAGTSTGFYVSEDEGQTWLDPGGGLGILRLQRVDGLAIDPSNDATMYASVNPGGMYKTTDGGANWSGLGGISGSDLQIDPGSPSTVYALGDRAGVQKSLDGGVSWAAVNSGIPAGLAFTALAMDRDLPSSLFVATELSTGGGAEPSGAPGIYRTTDGGATWNLSTDGLGTALVSAIAVSPSDSSTVYAAAGWRGVFVSTNGGETWAPTGGSLSAYITSLALDPVDPATIYAGTDAFVYRSRDGGTSWQSMRAGAPAPVPVVYSLSIDATGTVLHAGTPMGVFDYRMSFLDVPPADPYYQAIRTFALNLITMGCGSGNYCPDSTLTRAQAAVLLLRSEHGSGYLPVPASGTVFADVPVNAFAAAWIEQLHAEGITSGCGPALFCPASPVSRAQLAVLLLKTRHGPNHVPPPPTGAVFFDVPADAFGAAWIEELASEGITLGCGGGNFCPDDPATRAQAAVLFVRTFGLR